MCFRAEENEVSAKCNVCNCILLVSQRGTLDLRCSGRKERRKERKKERKKEIVATQLKRIQIFGTRLLAFRKGRGWDGVGSRTLRFVLDYTPKDPKTPTTKHF